MTDRERYMYWNHRVMRTVDDQGDVTYGIHEVYYNAKDEPEGWTQDPVPLMADTEEDLRDLHEIMSMAFTKSPLDKKGNPINNV